MDQREVRQGEQELTTRNLQTFDKERQNDSYDRYMKDLGAIDYQEGADKSDSGSLGVSNSG